MLFLLLLAIPVTSQSLKTFHLNNIPKDIASSFDGDFIYVLTSLGQVVKLDSSTGNIISTEFNQKELPPELSILKSYKGYSFELNPLDDSITISCSYSDFSQKIAAGNTPSAYVISDDNMFIANAGDSTVSVVDLKSSLGDIPNCTRSYYWWFVAALSATFLFLLLAFFFGYRHLSLLEEEKKLARFIIDHLEAGHHIEDIHDHMHKYVHPDRVHKATNRAYAHLEKVRSGKKSRLI